MEKDLREIKKMLRAVFKGQSSLRQSLSSEIKALTKTVTANHEEAMEAINKVDKRVDTLGKDLAFLEEDTPTREEHENLEVRVSKLENVIM